MLIIYITISCTISCAKQISRETAAVYRIHCSVNKYIPKEAEKVDNCCFCLYRRLQESITAASVVTRG